MDPLANLHDITTTSPIGWWPLAWGWWVLLISSVSLIAVITTLWLKRRRHQKALRYAKHQLALVVELGDPQQQIQQLNQLLKKVAKHYFGGSQINNLHGERWCLWLQEQLPNKHRDTFSRGALPALSSQFVAPSSSPSETVAAEFLASCECWFTYAQLERGATLNRSQTELETHQHV